MPPGDDDIESILHQARREKVAAAPAAEPDVDALLAMAREPEPAQPAPEGEMTIGEPSAIVTSGSGITRNIREQPLKDPQRDRASELALTLAQLGNRSGSQRIANEWAAKGQPLASDANAYPELPIPNSPFLAAPEADTLGRTARDNAYVAADAAWQGFMPKIAGKVEEAKAALGMEHDPWHARRIKERVQLAHQRSPKTTFATEMAFGALPWMAMGLPESPGALLATGAGQGAVSGLGHSEAQDWQGYAEDAAVNAAQGAAMTLPFAVAAPAAKAVMQATGEALERGAPAVRQQAGRANMRHALGRDFEAVANERGGMQGIDELAEFARKEGLDKGRVPQGVDTFRGRARGIANEAVDTQRNQATQAENLGIDVDVKPIIADLRAQAAEASGDVAVARGNIGEKYGAQADRIEELSPKEKQVYYDAGLIDYPAKQEDFVWIATPEVHPEQFAAGKLEGIGGASGSPGIGDLYPGAPDLGEPNYLVEMPRNVGGKPQVTDVDYSGTREAGRKAFANDMRVLRRVTEGEPEKLVGQLLSDAYRRLPPEYQESAKWLLNYGKPSIKTASSAEDLVAALEQHYSQQGSKLIAAQEERLAKEAVRIDSIQDKGERAAARAQLGQQRRVLAADRKAHANALKQFGGEPRDALIGALEDAMAHRVKKFAAEQEAIPTSFDPAKGVKGGGSMAVSPSDTRIFTRPGQEPPNIPGYTHGGVIEPGADIIEHSNEARRAVDAAWPPVYGPFTEEVPGRLPFKQAHEQRIKLDDAVYGDRPSADEGQAAEVAHHTAGLYRRGMQGALEERAPELAADWQRNQKRMADALTIANPAARKYVREQAKQAIDLPSISGGGSWLGTALALARKARPDATIAKGLYGLEAVMKDAGGALRQAKPMRPASILGETGAEWAGSSRGTVPAYAQAQKEAADDGRGHLSADGARKLLATNPAALGPYANKWRKAIDSGDSAKVSALMQTLERDPTYNRYVKRLITDQTKTNR